MKVSYAWLQSFFDTPLPTVDVLVETANFKIAEIDGVEKVGEDSVIDIKILADRAAYMLSHRGVAREYSATLELKLKDRQIPVVSVTDAVAVPDVKLESELCRRYSARRVEGVNVGASPEWLVSALAGLGQRSINNIVDMANYIMFDIGQPLHAFDADKVVGNITVRLATPDDQFELLSRKLETNITEHRTMGFLNSTCLVIADDVGPLAVAGAKGGKRAEVTSATKNLILESANFNPSSVRKTSTRLNLRTDASKRFENDLTPDLTLEALENFSSLIAENQPDAKFGKISDTYSNPEQEQTVGIDPSLISARLGMQVPVGEQEKILIRMGLGVSKVGEMFSVTVPTYRRDLNIAEDFAEEIGRIWGYDKLPETLPKPVKPAVNKVYYYTEKVRNILRDAGFSEVYLYSLVPKGELEVQLPLAEDKKCYRTNLLWGLGNTLRHNRTRKSLLLGEEIKVFEFGDVFCGGEEEMHLAIAMEDKSTLDEACKKLETGLGGHLEEADPEDSQIISLEFSSSNSFAKEYVFNVAKLPEPESYDDLNISLTTEPAVFKQYSLYPHVSRDIAVWVPNETEAKMLEKMIGDNAGELLVKMSLFDTFTKDNRTSYAYRLVFQSLERTLTDVEVNKTMDKISGVLSGTPNFTVR